MGQNAFYKMYSENGSDFGQGIVQLTDSSYSITGSSSSFTSNAQAYIMHIDTGGNYMWSRHYGGSESDWGVRIMHIPNDGYLVAGFSNSFGNGDYDPYYFKTDLNGNLLWEESITMPGWQRVLDATLTADSGLVMVGFSDTLNEDGLIIKTDKSGNVEWSHFFGAEGNDRATSVEIYHDSIIVVGGTVFVADSLKNKASLLFYDLNGSLLFSDTLGSNGNYFLNDIVIVGDTLQGVGAKFFNDPDDKDRLGINYNLVNNFAFGTQENPEVGSFESKQIIAYGDNSKRYIAYEIIASFTNPFGTDYHIGRFANNLGWNGQVVQVIYDYPDVSGQMIPTSDGGAIATGYTTGGMPGHNSVFVVKIGPNELYPDMTNYVSEQLVSIDETNLIDFNIYPNPSNGILTISHLSTNLIQYTITSVDGKQLIEGQFEGEAMLNLSHFARGSYFIHLFLDGKPLGSKIVLLD